MPHPLIDRALAALARPLTDDDLAIALGLRPRTVETDQVLDELCDDERIVFLGDGRVASSVSLLDGLVLWHRVDAVEVATRRVALGIDAAPVLAVVPELLVLVGAAPAPLVSSDGPEPGGRGAVVLLPDGWADDLAPGDLLAITAEGRGVRLHAPDDAMAVIALAPSAEGVVVALAEVLGSIAARRGGLLSRLLADDVERSEQWILDLPVAAGEVLAEAGAALRGLGTLPLREALVRAGLTVRSGLVGGPGVAPDVLDVCWQGRLVVGPLSAPVALIEDCGIGADVLIGSSVPADEAARGLHDVLDDPLVAGALVEHLRGTTADVVATAERRLRPVDGAHPDDPGPAWLRAALMVRQGRAHDARDLLDGVVDRLDDEAAGRWADALATAARLRAIGGDLRGAAALHRRAGDGHLARRLDRWGGDPAQRVGLLWENLTGWALAEQPTCTARSAELAAVVAGARDDRTVQGLVAAVDAELLEGGGLAVAIDEVGALLSPEERELAIRWRATGHRLWVVESAGPSPVWRDVGDGTRARIIGPIEAGAHVELPEPGAHVVAAVLPGVAGHHVVGRPVPVANRDVEPVARVVACGLDALGVAALVGVLTRPDDADGPSDAADAA